MLAGYVTYNELKLITGFSDRFLNKLIVKGMNINEADLEYERLNCTSKHKQVLFNLQDVEDWLKVHVF